ncbi:MAG: hypothetical protein C0501_13965 [Isosphaera sp.]|nr:hypothetical protein [Isosphaera sp.]
MGYGYEPAPVFVGGVHPVLAGDAQGLFRDGGRPRATRFPRRPAHDAFTRLPRRLEPDPQVLCSEVRALVGRPGGRPVLDDGVSDKPHARHIGLAGPFWSGRHNRVVRNINLVTLAWTDGNRVYPTDYRLVGPAERPERTENDPFREPPAAAHERGFSPPCVVFHAWHSGGDNLKAVRDRGWTFPTRVRGNRR